MRAVGSDVSIELVFDCAAASGTFKRQDIVPTQHLKIESISGSVVKTAAGGAVVPSGVNLLVFSLRGTLIARTGSNSRLILMPPRSLTFIRNARVVLQAARGEHQHTLITWQSGITPLLDHWVVTRHGSRAGAPARSVASKPIDPHLRLAETRFNQAIEGGGDEVEPLVLSVIYDVVPRLMTGPDQVQLAATPLDLPETIQELIQRVRAKPSMPWPLKEAADAAGYSPFHFSRVFKNLVGYGFHEYVDRCRTECAVELLCTSDIAVDLVASQCGFGTTQGLRESVKEYLGLVPSELRSAPDSIGFTE
jgi:AraC-like DNA-binding protein